MDFITPLIFGGLLILLFVVVPYLIINDNSGKQAYHSPSSNITPFDKNTPPARGEDFQSNPDHSISEDFKSKYGEIYNKYLTLQQKYDIQTTKLYECSEKLRSLSNNSLETDTQLQVYEKTIANLQTIISDLEAKNSSLKNQLNQTTASSIQLSKIPPHRWKAYISQTFGYGFQDEQIHYMVQNYLQTEAESLKETLLNVSESNLSAIPYMAEIMADYETHSLELLASQLSWGESQERAKKVKSIREIRRDAHAMVEKNLEAKYQLEYLLALFPNLRDVIETDYNELPIIDATQISAYDRTRDWLSKEEYQSLSSIERNQLALDRYKVSHNKTKWQIGRDYELYVGYRYTLKGYSVDYYGSYMGMEDLGRDLIAKKDDTILIIQCKYWSQIKTIHEKHINQLYGTMICYCIEHDLSPDQVKGVLVTNITLSDTAKKMAQYLRIECVENFERGDYPCIKCNIGHGEHGTEKIYHLPFDQQYDATKINAPGEFYAMTVKEAEEAGFRRAFKWFAGD